MRVAVIGAGPSGLVTLKYLQTAHQFFPIQPIEAVLFEAEDAVGGTFAHRTYEDAEVGLFCYTSHNDHKLMWPTARLIQAAHYLFGLSPSQG